MDPSIYRRMAQTQHDHWWFRARRSILKAQLERLGLPHPARVLEVGCGTGANLSMLSAFGQVDAMELDDFALEIARQEACADVRKGWLPNGIPFDGGARYDAVCLFDVLEHCENDHAALEALAPRLADRGVAIVTVPAYQWLFGEHDRLHHHYRRYTASGLREVATRAGFQWVSGGYFNSILFPAVAVRRTLARLGVGADTDDSNLPSPILNSMLTRVFAAERLIVPFAKFPFGTSVLAVLRAAH